MRKFLLFILIVIGVNANANAQSDTTLVSSDNMVQSSVDAKAAIICTDTVRLGNFYVTALAGSRLAFEKTFYGTTKGYLTEWGKNYGGLIAYRTLNGRFSFETGYLHRTIHNINRISFGGRDYDLILETKINQVPIHLKTRVLNKFNERLTLSVITGMNFTSVNTTDFELSGTFNLVSQKDNTLVLHSKNPWYMEEEFVVKRNLNTGKNGNNKHISPEIGLEGSFQLSKRLEAGAVVTYQHNFNPYEDLDIRFVGNNNFASTDYNYNGPNHDAISLNLALILRYNFNKLTFLKCDKPAIQ